MVYIYIYVIFILPCIFSHPGMIFYIILYAMRGGEGKWEFILLHFLFIYIPIRQGQILDSAKLPKHKREEGNLLHYYATAINGML